MHFLKTQKGMSFGPLVFLTFIGVKIQYVRLRVIYSIPETPKGRRSNRRRRRRSIKESFRVELGIKGKQYISKIVIQIHQRGQKSG